MNSYDWDEVVKHRNVLRDELDKTDWHLSMGKEMNQSMQLIMRIAAHLSASSVVSGVSKGADPYYLGVYLFALGIMIDADRDVAMPDIIKYINTNVGDGKTTFDTDFIDATISNMYKSVLPFIGGVSNEYANTELITLTDYHIVKLAKLLMTGAMTGIAIRKTIKDDDGKPKTWFFDFQEYVTKVYAEVTSDNGAPT